MIFIGIDPGKSGALAAIRGNGAVEVLPMPIVAPVKGKGRKQYDIGSIRDWLLRWPNLDLAMVTIEKSQPMPPKMPGGSITNFERGVCRGFAWLCAGLYQPHQLVHPRTWQRAMHAGTPAGDTKQRSIIAAKQLFPSVSLKRTERCRKDEDGIAEALLLAEFGRRTYSSVREETA